MVSIEGSVKVNQTNGNYYLGEPGMHTYVSVNSSGTN
jgi:hypothetical protein